MTNSKRLINTSITMTSTFDPVGVNSSGHLITGRGNVVQSPLASDSSNTITVNQSSSTGNTTIGITQPLIYPNTMTVTGNINAEGSIVAGSASVNKVTLSAGSISAATGQNLAINMGGNGTTVSFPSNGTGTPLLITSNTTQNVVDFTRSPNNLALLNKTFVNLGTITYPSGARQDTFSPLTVSSNAAGDVSGTPGYPYYYMRINGDSATTDTIAVCLKLAHNYGAGSTGNRSGFNVTLNQTSATGNLAVSKDPFFVGAQAVSQMSFSEGGTGTRFNQAVGHNFAFNPYAHLYPGATNIYENNGAEFNVVNEAGSSCARSDGLQIVHPSQHAIQGTCTDTAILIADQIGCQAGWRDGILIGDPTGISPLDPINGTLMRARLSFHFPTIPLAAKDGINIQELTCSNLALLTRNAALSGAGNLRIGTGYVNPTSTGISIDASGSIGLAEGATISGGALVSGGTGGFIIQDVLRSSNSGVVHVTAVNGSGVITQLTVYRSSYASGSPAVNETYISDPSSAGTGTVTIAQTWTASSKLQLQPTAGGTLQTGSGTWTANASTAVSLTNIAPAGASATVQEWFTVKNASGVTRYIPAF